MKRLLSICMLAAVSCGICNAQQRYHKELLSDNELNYMYYSYKNNRVDSIYQAIPTDRYSSYRILEYDEAGNNIFQKRYQKPKNSDTYIYTDNVYFTYDENHRILTRKNYNADLYGTSNSFLLGGVYIYTYDFNGNLIKSQLYWDEELTRLYETVEYKYDENGRLMYDLRTSIQFDEPIQDTKQEYEYDAEGRLVRLIIHMLDYNTGKLKINTLRVYTYDENGNITEMKETLEDGTLMERHEYVYDTTAKASETIFPEHPDNHNILYTNCTNVVTEENIYMRDLQHGEIVYIDTERWEYGDNDMAGIQNVKYNADMSLVSMTSDKVVLGNIPGNADVRIYDASGRMVHNAAYKGSIDIAALPSGVYMIVTNGSSIKIRK